MDKLCTGSQQRDRWAVSLCFSSALLTSLDALHSGGCVWANLSPQQYYAVDAIIATVSLFLGTFILTRLLHSHGDAK
jgi:hypothetical protein